MCVYLSQLTFARGKSVACQPAYHAAATISTVLFAVTLDWEMETETAWKTKSDKERRERDNISPEQNEGKVMMMMVQPVRTLLC